MTSDIQRRSARRGAPPTPASNGRYVPGVSVTDGRYPRGARTAHRTTLAAEQSPHYRTDATDHALPVDAATDVNSDTGADACDRALLAAVDALVGVDLDDRGDDAIRAHLRAAQQAMDRLSSFRALATGALERRVIARAEPGREQGPLRDVRDELADQLRLSPGDVKRAGETGRRLGDRPASRDAMTSGKLPATHARLLGDTLRWLDGAARDEAEERLLAAAAEQDARTFGRTCRRVLAEVDAGSAQVAQRRRNGRRSLKVVQTPDGMLALHGQGSGLDAEYVQTALHAFRRPDSSGERRTSEQRTWDALVQVCRTALDVGAASTNRSVRPHVLVTVDESTVREGAGVAETAWSGPLPYSEVRALLADAGVSRVLTDAASLPLEVSTDVRTVPVGLWKALLVRDGTCIADGCTIPAPWCQVMHLDVPYRLQGRLSLDTAGLGCVHHHRMLDLNGWRVTWVHGRPVLHDSQRTLDRGRPRGDP